MTEDHRLGHDAAGIAHEIFEQSKLARLQLNLFPRARDLAAEQIQRQIANPERSRLGRFRSAPDECLHARENSSKAKGFTR